MLTMQDKYPWSWQEEDPYYSWHHIWIQMWLDIGKWSFYFGPSKDTRLPKSYTELLSENQMLEEHVEMLLEELELYRS